MIPIYNEQGAVIDVSDEGLFIANLENKIDNDIAMKRLTNRQQAIVRLKSEGYFYNEIAEQLGVNRKTIKREMSQIANKVSII